MTDDDDRLSAAQVRHKVKNVLAVIRAVALGSLSTSISLEGFREKFLGRLELIGKVESSIGVVGEIELHDLLIEQLAAHSAPDGRQYRLAGPRIVLRGKAAELLALAFHELTTNAVRYGALSQPRGRVRVSWSIRGDGETEEAVHLEWREEGVRAVSLSPPRRGFGRELLEVGLAYELGAKGEMSFRPGGMAFNLEAPLSKNVCRTSQT